MNFVGVSSAPADIYATSAAIKTSILIIYDLPKSQTGFDVNKQDPLGKRKAFVKSC